MNRFDINKRLIFLLCTGFLVIGCAHYYEVKDPVTGNVYYTEDVDREGSAAEFKDARTGQKITIQNSEIREIDKSDFEGGRAASVKKSTPPPNSTAPPESPSGSSPESTPPSEP